MPTAAIRQAPPAPRAAPKAAPAATGFAGLVDATRSLATLCPAPQSGRPAAPKLPAATSPPAATPTTCADAPGAAVTAGTTIGAPTSTVAAVTGAAAALSSGAAAAPATPTAPADAAPMRRVPPRKADDAVSPINPEAPGAAVGALLPPPGAPPVAAPAAIVPAPSGHGPGAPERTGASAAPAAAHAAGRPAAAAQTAHEAVTHIATEPPLGAVAGPRHAAIAAPPPPPPPPPPIAPAIARAGASAPRIATAASPAAQVAHALIGVSAGNGLHRLTVQLAPQELGRLQISVARGADGTASVSITAERAETLSLVQSDAAQLHGALDKAGLPAARALHFYLAEPGQSPAAPGAEAAGLLNGGGGGGQPAGGQSGQQRSAWTDAPGAFIAPDDLGVIENRSAGGAGVVDITA